MIANIAIMTVGNIIAASITRLPLSFIQPPLEIAWL